MKSLFIRRMSQMLTFMFLVSGLDLSADLKSCVQKAKKAALPAEQKAENACYTVDNCRDYTGAECDLNFTFNTGSKASITIPKTGISALGNLGSGGPLGKFQDTTLGLAEALAAYKRVNSNYNNTTFVYTSSLNLYQNMLAHGSIDPKTGKVDTPTGVIPFAEESTGQKSAMYSKGDFLPAASLAADKGALIAGYMRYLSSSQIDPSTGEPSMVTESDGTQITKKQEMRNVLANILLLSSLVDTNNIAENSTINSGDLDSVRKALVSARVSTFDNLKEASVFGVLPLVVGGQFKIFNFDKDSFNRAGSQILALMNQEDENMVGLSGETLYSIFNLFTPGSKKLANFKKVFKGTDFSSYILNVILSILGNKLYFSCGLDTTGQGISSNLYYSSDAKGGSLSLQGQVNADSKKTSSSDEYSAGFINGSTSFPYQTGTFYYLLPEKLMSSGTEDPIQLVDGPVGLAGLGNGTGENSLWFSVCKNSGSQHLLNTQNEILNKIKELSGKALSGPAVKTDSSGNQKGVDTQYRGTTVQGASYNLLNAARAALKTSPLSDLVDKGIIDSSWVQKTYHPGNIMYADSNGKPAVLTYGFKDKSGNYTAASSVQPHVLVGFESSTPSDTDAFMTSDHEQQMLDWGNLRAKYSSCWMNVAQCANLTKIGKAVPVPWYSSPELVASGTIIGLVGGIAMISAPVMWIRSKRAAYKAAKAAKASATNSQQEVVKESSVSDAAPTSADAAVDAATDTVTAATNTATASVDAGEFTEAAGRGMAKIGTKVIDNLQSASEAQISEFAKLKGLFDTSGANAISERYIGLKKIVGELKAKGRDMTESDKANVKEGEERLEVNEEFMERNDIPIPDDI